MSTDEHGRLTDAEREALGQRLMLTMTCNHGSDYFGAGAVCETCFANVQRIGRIVERIVAAREDKARREGGAEVLRDTANAWTQGAWSDVMLPKPTPPAVPVIAYSNRVGDWLRDRADRLDADGGAE